jgi:hypothetical protein
MYGVSNEQILRKREVYDEIYVKLEEGRMERREAREGRL